MAPTKNAIDDTSFLLEPPEVVSAKSRGTSYLISKKVCEVRYIFVKLG